MKRSDGQSKTIRTPSYPSVVAYGSSVIYEINLIRCQAVTTRPAQYGSDKVYISYSVPKEFSRSSFNRHVAYKAAE